MGALVVRRFRQEGDVELVSARLFFAFTSSFKSQLCFTELQARDFVRNSNALERTHQLARNYASKALDALSLLPRTDARVALASLAEKVVDRAK